MSTAPDTAHGPSIGAKIFIGLLLLLFAAWVIGFVTKTFRQDVMGYPSGNGGFQGVIQDGGGSIERHMIIRHPFPNVPQSRQYRCRLVNGMLVPDDVGTGWCHD